MRIDIVLKAIKFNSFPPPPPLSYCVPPPPHFYCFPSTTTTTTTIFSLFSSTTISATTFPLFFSTTVNKRLQTTIISSVCRNVSSCQEQLWFSSVFSCFPAHQRQFLLRTASPQQLHALVQVLYNILKEYILIPEENKRNVLPYKDALVNLAETNVPYKTKKRILVQEGDGFIQDLLVPAVTSLGFLML